MSSTLHNYYIFSPKKCSLSNLPFKFIDTSMSQYLCGYEIGYDIFRWKKKCSVTMSSVMLPRATASITRIWCDWNDDLLAVIIWHASPFFHLAYIYSYLPVGSRRMLIHRQRQRPLRTLALLTFASAANGTYLLILFFFFFTPSINNFGLTTFIHKLRQTARS